MTTPALSSLLLASTNLDRLRQWYVDVLGGQLDPDGFVHFGPMTVLIDGRSDVAAAASEPGRVILNYTVTNMAQTVRDLDEHGVTWLAPAEYREQGGAWFATLLDPDGNYVQIIQLSEKHRAEVAGN